MTRIVLSICMVVTLILLAIGVALASAGLGTKYWMTFEMSGAEIRVGLFQICMDSYYISRCISTLDLATDGDDYALGATETMDFLVCKICIISGIILGLSGIVSCVIFILMNTRGSKMIKGPFIAAMISNISSVICIVAGVFAFGVLIHKESKGFDLDYSFTLTCVATVPILIGCIVFGVAAAPLLKNQSGGSSNPGIVYMTNPPPVAIQQYGAPQNPGVQYGYDYPGPQKTFQM